MKSVPSVALIFFATSRALIGVQPVSLPLTPEQVTCEERQMGRLSHRFSADYNGSTLFLWRASAVGGWYHGLISTSELFHDPSSTQPLRLRQENQLAFELILRSEGDFLNPRRPLLPQATLVRRDTASNLDVPPSLNGSLSFSIDLAATVPNPDNPTIPLVISTRRNRGEEKADGAGRGLEVDDLLTPCHGEVTEFDQRVFAILARTVRPTACLSDPPGSPGCLGDRFKTVVYRGMEPFTYRVDVFLYSAHCNDDGTCTYGEGRIPFLFRIRVDDRSRLLDGTADAFPFCETSGQLDCIDPGNPWIAVYVLPPLRPGVETQDEAVFRRSVHLSIVNLVSDENVLHADVNWADLLRDTAWNGGLAQTGEGLPGGDLAHRSQAPGVGAKRPD